MSDGERAAIELPETMRRAALLNPAEALGEGPEAELRVAMSSEVPVAWWWGVEVLGHSPGEVDLRAFDGPRGLPLLRDHRNELDAVVGRVTGPELRDGRLYARVRFAPHPEAQALRQRVLDGTLGEVSVGYSIEAMTLAERGAKGQADTYRVTRWTPRELSLVAVPADHTAGLGRGQGERATRMVVIQSREPEMGDKTEQAPAVTDQGTDKRAAAAATARQAELDAVAARERELREAMAADRARIAEIDQLGARFNVPRAVIDAAKANGTTLAEFRGVVIEHLGDGAQTQLGQASNIGMGEREVEQFSFRRLFLGRALNDMARLCPFELEVVQAAADAAGRDGRKVQGFMVPQDVLGSGRFMTHDMAARAAAVAQHFGRVLVVGDKSDGTGGQSVDTVLATGSFIDMLRNMVVLNRAGVRTLSGLVGDVAVPKQTGAAIGAWVGENTPPTETTQTLGQVTLKPKTYAAWSSYSRRLLLQSTMDVEAFIRADLAAVLAIGIDHAAINGTADADGPDGLADYAASINTINLATASKPTWAEVIQCQGEVDTDNALTGALGYIMHPLMRAYLMSTPKVSSADSVMMMGEAGNMLAGYGALRSAQVATTDLWFGNWADMILGYWSGLDINADPFTSMHTGATRVIAMQDVDVAIRNAGSFCLAKKAS